MNKISLATMLAIEAHKNQFRKSSNTPYILHPLEVGTTLFKYGCSDELIIAGILHDTLEDTEVTQENLLKMFGKEITNLVLDCSEPDKKLTWEKRKHHTIDNIKNLSMNSKLVMCADKLSNLKSILKDYETMGEELWKRFNRGKKKQIWYYTNIAKQLDKSHPLFIEYQKLASTLG